MTAVIALAAALISGVSHCSVSAFVEPRSFRPGVPFTVAFRLRPESGWHTYWANPGDSGSATTADWRLPAGWKAGPLQFPVPGKIRVGDFLVCYGYGSEHVLLQTLTPPAAVKPGSLTEIPVTVSWVACKEECVSGGGELRLKLRAGDGSPDPLVTRLFHSAREAMALSLPEIKARAIKAGERYRLEVVSAQPWTADAAQSEFFPLDREALEHADPQSVTVSGRVLTLILKPSGFQSVVLRRLRGVLAAPNPSVFLKKSRGLLIDVPIEAS